MFRATRKRDRNGAAAVEFALTAIPFVLFVFGVLEFGRLILMQHLVTNAAREGARLVSLNTDVSGSESNMTTDQIEAEIISAMAGQELQNLDIDIVHLEAGPNGWNQDATFQHRIAVDIEGLYEPMTPLLYFVSGGALDSIPVSARAIAYSEGH